MTQTCWITTAERERQVGYTTYMLGVQPHRKMWCGGLRLRVEWHLAGRGELPPVVCWLGFDRRPGQDGEWRQAEEGRRLYETHRPRPGDGPRGGRPREAVSISGVSDARGSGTAAAGGGLADPLRAWQVAWSLLLSCWVMLLVELIGGRWLARPEWDADGPRFRSRALRDDELIAVSPEGVGW